MNRILGYVIFAVFVVTPTVLMSPVSVAQTQEEAALWNGVKDSKDAEDYKAYLDKYPNGIYAPIAKRRVAQYSAHSSEQAASAQASTVRAAPDHATSKSGGAPITMTECEGTNNCGTWTFLGTQGNGQWPSGDMANLSVEHFDSSSVVIRRSDSTGPSAGLTAEYRGIRNGDRIAGEFTMNRPDQAGHTTGNWYATLGKAMSQPPAVAHGCVADGCNTGNGGTLTWEKDHYLNLPDVPGQRTVLTVERWTPESVVLHRTNSGRYPGTAIWTGQISAQGNSIVNGVQTSPNGRSVPFKMAWGNAIDTVPGSRNIPDPVVVVAPVVCMSWFLTVVCGR